MLTSAELFHKFQRFIERDEFILDNPNFRMEYASRDLGLEMGYYSLSKTDLYIGGTKRGHLIKKPGKYFNGYVYCFLEDQLQIVKELVDGKDRRIIFLEYEGNFCYGYCFDYLGKLEPNRCFAYEMDGKIAVGFKTFSYYPHNDMLKEDIIRYEKYIYINGVLSAIDVKETLFDFESETERLLSEDVYDFFTGEFWVPSRCAAKDIDQDNNRSNVVYDNQKKLTKKLERKIKNVSSLDQAIKTFFDVVSKASPNAGAMILYEVGCYPADENTKAFMFYLIRQTPSEEGEYYQMILQLQYGFSNELCSISEYEWRDSSDSDLYEYVMKSEAYNVLKDKKIKNIRVWADET